MKYNVHFNISVENYKYIKDYKIKNSLPSLSLALDKIILEHIDNSKQETKKFVRELSKQISKELTPILEKLQTVVNTSDKNGRLSVMLLNQLMLNSPRSIFSERTSMQLVEATKRVDKEMKQSNAKSKEYSDDDNIFDLDDWI